MTSKYEHFTVEKFLQDDFFIRSVLHPSDESESLWNEILSENPSCIGAFNQARTFILTLDQGSPPHLPPERLNILWQRIKKTNQKNKNRKLYLRLTAAACTIACILGTYSVIKEKPVQNNTQNNQADISLIRRTATSDSIQLILSDNTVKVTGDEVLIDYRSEGKIKINEEALQKKNPSGENDKVAYNQLKVPFGKRSSLILSDGSKIWVNAGTWIVFPETFDAQKREIFVDGEIYGNIAGNPDKPFIIKTKSLEVEVLGTSLNVTAYEKDPSHSVVLVTGSARVSLPNKKTQMMKPNQRFYTQDGNAFLENVDVMNYTSWKDGWYRFNREELGVILKRVSKYYGIEVHCSPSAAKLTCSGSLDLKEEAQRVLEGLCSAIPVNCILHNGIYEFTIK